jgi:hypothetical protein
MARKSDQRRRERATITLGLRWLGRSLQRRPLELSEAGGHVLHHPSPLVLIDVCLRPDSRFRTATGTSTFGQRNSLSGGSGTGARLRREHP